MESLVINCLDSVLGGLGNSFSIIAFEIGSGDAGDECLSSVIWLEVA
jgi:hypothetical protein